MSLGRGLFDPDPEPGDNWKQLAALIVAATAFVVFDQTVGRAGLHLVMGVVGLVLLVPVVAGIVRLLR